MEMKLIDKAEFTSKRYQAHAEFWTTILSRIDEPFILSQRGHLLNETGSKECKVICHPEKELQELMTSLIKGNSQNIYVVALSALFILLSRYTSAKAPVICVPPLKESSSGNSTLLLTQSLNDLTIREHLRLIQNLAADAHRYEDYPISMIDAGYGPPARYSNVHLFCDGMHAHPTDITTTDLRFFVGIDSQGFNLGIAFNEGYITEVFANQILRHWNYILQYFATLDGKVDNVSLINADENMRLQKMGMAEVYVWPHTNIVEAFEHQVARTPSNIAVVKDETYLSFDELNNKANRVAHFLRNEYFIKPGDRIGIMMNRSEFLIISILAVLKAGAAYVPIDPQYPVERKTFILSNSDTKVLLIESAHMSDITDVSQPILVIDLQLEDIPANDKNIDLKPSGDDLAYIIYTSGSTGQPKGVMIEHRNIINTLYWSISYYEFDSSDVRLQFPSFSFDSSVTDIFGSLLSGGKLILLDYEKRTDLLYLDLLIQKHEVTNFLLVPSFYRVVLEGLGKKLSNLRKIIVAGEAIDSSLVKKHYAQLPNTLLANEYGPTENAVCSTVTILSEDTQVTIGKPIYNVSVFIVDQNLNLLPEGVPGELMLSGLGIARGYWQDETLTKEKFLFNHQGEKLYLTGDLAQWTNEGEIVFLGRKDEQVKIRGFRVEPGEIENLLKQHNEVRDAVVTTFANQQKTLQLAAYIIRNEPVSDDDLTEYLAGKVPDFMVPIFISVDDFPRTPSGKIDRRSLPDPLVAREKDKVHTSPSNATEVKLVEIWKSILNVEELGVEENFFALGGHSLSATQLMSRIHLEFNVRIDLREIFDYNTIASLAQLVNNAHIEKFEPITKVLASDLYEVSHAQRRLWIMDKLQSGANYNIPAAYKLTGKLNIDAFINAFNTVVERHEILRTTFVEVDGTPMQRIHRSEDYKFAVEFDDFSSLADRHEWIQNIANEDALRKFDLTQGPLMRARIIQSERHQYAFLLNMHHIVTDAWSMQILFNEVIAIYNSLLGHFKLELETLEIQYKDFASWQNRQLNGELLESHRGYWMNCFSGELPTLELATDFPRSDIRSSSGDVVLMSLGKNLSERMHQFCREQDVSLFMMLIAVLKTLLFRYTGQEDIIIGSPIAGRTHYTLENQIGFYVNTLALRSTFKGNHSFLDLLSQVRNVTLGAYDHQVYPFDKLIDDLQLERNTKRTPLFDVNLVLQNADVSGVDGIPSAANLHELHVDSFEFNFKTNRFDLLVNCNEYDNSIQINFEYNDKLFTRERITRMSHHFKCLINSILAQPNELLKNFNIISAKERDMILFDLGMEKYPDYSNDLPVHLVIENIASIHPNKPAIVSADGEISYKMLNERANRLANFILEKKLAANSVIAMIMKPSVESTIAMLAILKTGYTYLPIDPGYPFERTKFILQDANTSFLIVEKNCMGMAGRLQWECQQLKHLLYIDAEDIYGVDEQANQLMNQELWDFVGENAVDSISGGGWVSSYTGKKFSPDEMEEYGVNIFQKTRPFITSTARVLEIGCASGISMFMIAPEVGYYLGTDLSAKILDFTSERVASSNLRNIELKQVAALQIDTLTEKDFDLIVCNSVIQSFSGYNYLRDVVKKSIAKLKDESTLVFGDVQDLELKPNLLKSLEDFGSKPENQQFNTKTDWTNELFVPRQFFEDLQLDFPEIERVEFSRKIGAIDNELTLFRYDVIIHVNKTRHKDLSSSTRHKHQYSSKDFHLCEATSPKLQMSGTDLAYIIYTSGTTGNPKGVQITHTSLSNYVSWASSYYFRDGEGNMPLITSLAFDLTVTSIYCPLVRGKSIYVFNSLDMRDVLHDVFSDLRIDSIKLTPSHIAVLNYIPQLPYTGISNVIVGGEKLYPNHVDILKSFNKDVTIFNEYGPTETTVGCTVSRVRDSYFDIGRPIGGARICILDPNLNVLPVGNLGELCVAGAGVSSGYLRKDALTSSKFIDSPFIKDEKMYLTGDIARWLEDGTLELQGRKDLQVKLRGHRIELEEIEKTMMRHTAIRQSAVIIRPVDGQETIIGYYSGTKSLKHETLYEFLCQYLPEYMIPSVFIKVSSFTLTLNGKLNVNSLPLPEDDVKQDENYQKPSNDIEQKIHDIWREVLGGTKISIRDNFFRVGGHSLKATQVLARISKEMNTKIDLAYLFNNPTIEALASKIELSDWVRNSSEYVVDDNEENFVI